jgi:hypothetical protein
MIPTTSGISSLNSLLQRWEIVEYVSAAIVLLGVIGEFLTEFTNFLKVREDAHRKNLLGKFAVLVLIAGLAVELVSLVRTSQLSEQVTARLNEEAGQARSDAGTAAERAGKAEERAGLANERASNNEKEAARLRREAARLSKLAEEERLGRVKIEEKLAPRHLTAEQQHNITTKLQRFAGQRINVFVYAGDAEITGIANEIINALGPSGGAGWILNISSGNEASRAVPGILVEVRPEADVSSLAAASFLATALRNERLVVFGPQLGLGPSGMVVGVIDEKTQITVTIGKKP